MAVQITPTQATSGISLSLRNNIYSALLSGPGIRNIEATLDECLRSSGFRDNLKTYITHLFRSGQATTAEEAYKLAIEKIKEAMADLDPSATTTNGNDANHGSANPDDAAGEGLNVHLNIPKEVVTKGTKVVLRELEKICEITYEE
ncbi:hypothetical protein IAQ61_005412 [Plenodomus lingam]|uniref:Uncharacterized protein n=1 Tax=Leptosphaeria maculans (strain JN3 / isolate v23.1.3 / race Av1-4-5-6-7-8) TaxID=985895 RepID=E4ZZD0_LEPMJ|nr:hypothetical protein LEMA_P109900.1 [Plenodomus lingam JN3]KAH9871233.1 hypothetical protein IAQ61_005412 [Plenodomus lingam]CBX96725.1 hypothetical protein LEMA_P109900.1 [Plenodomus lingam JN3]